MENYPVVDATTGKRLPNPSMPLDHSVKGNNITFTSDSGMVQIRPRGRMKNTFSFKYIALNKDQWKTIKDFFISRRGGYESFKWTDPTDHVEYTVRFSNEELVGNLFGHTGKTPLYSCEIKLEEVL